MRESSAASIEGIIHLWQSSSKIYCICCKRFDSPVHETDGLVHRRRECCPASSLGTIYSVLGKVEFIETAAIVLILQWVELMDYKTKGDRAAPLSLSGRSAYADPRVKSIVSAAIVFILQWDILINDRIKGERAAPLRLSGPFIRCDPRVKSVGQPQ